MGLGDFISSKAEMDYIRRERKREIWEIQNFPEGEKIEMINLYVHEKGIDLHDAEQMVNILAKYPDFWADVMMNQELKLMPPDDEDNPAIDGLFTFGSFVVFGSVPLLSYIGNIETKGFNANFLLACLLTAFTLLCLGVAKAHFTKQNMILSSLLMLFNGGIAATAAFAIGWGISRVGKI